MRPRKLCYVMFLACLILNSAFFPLMLSPDTKHEEIFTHVGLKTSHVTVGDYIVPGISNQISNGDLIKIGHLRQIDHFAGNYSWDGALLAAREINEEGGVKIAGSTRYIGLAQETTDSTVPGAEIASQRLVLQKQPTYVIGSLLNESTYVSREVAMDFQRLYFSTGAYEDDLCDRVSLSYNRYKYFFRIAPNNQTILGEYLFYYLWSIFNMINTSFLDYDVSDIGIIYEDTDYGTSAMIDMVFAISSYTSYNVVSQIACPLDSTPSEMNGFLTTLNSTGCDIVIPLFHENISVLMSREYANLQPNYLLVGVDYYSEALDSHWNATNGGCKYEIISQRTYNTQITPKSEPFWYGFIEEFGYEPSPEAAKTYDTVYLIAEMIEETNSLNPDVNVQYLENLSASNSFSGATGHFVFTSLHDVRIGHDFLVLLMCQWNANGKKVVIPVSTPSYPSYLATGYMEYPPWILSIWEPDPYYPKNFNLFCDNDYPADKDGIITLNWTESYGANNYSVYSYDQPITEINGSLTQEVSQTDNLTLTISNLPNGERYYIVVAHNSMGNITSNLIKTSIGLAPKEFTLFENEEMPVDLDGTFMLNWTTSLGADNYSVYMYDHPITHITGDLILLANQTSMTEHLVSGISTGEYYFIVEAYNQSGKILSNNIMIVVEIDSPQGLNSFLGEIVIIIVILSVIGVTILSTYTFYSKKQKGKIWLAKKRKKPIKTLEKREPKKATVKKKSLDVVPEAIPWEGEEDEIFDDDINLIGDLDKCVVHKGVIKGMSYICPHCHAKYCIKCIKSVADKKERCWVCNTENFVTEESFQEFIPSRESDEKSPSEAGFIPPEKIESKKEPDIDKSRVQSTEWDLWRKIETLELSLEDKTELIKNLLSLSPIERKEIIDGMLELHLTDNENPIL